MRILMLAPPWFTVPPAGYGGTEWVVSLLTEGLVEAGHEVALVASGGSRTNATLITVFEEPPTKRIGSPAHDLLHLLAGYSRRHEFDLVHDHSGCIGPSLGAMLDGPPVVHTLHGPWVPELAALYASLPPKLHLVAISHDQRSRAPHGVRVDAVVHNAIPIECYPLRGDRRGTAAYLAWVGRATPDKGPEIAIEVARRTGRPLRMAIKINEPEEERYWQARLAPRLDGVDVEVIRNATTEQKATLLAGADATLFPIQWPEPFGLVMAESMACGTPVIAYREGSVPEVIADAQTGILVDPGDIDGLCAAVERAGEIDPAACRGWVQRQMSAPAMVRRYERVYRDVLAGHPEIRLETDPAEPVAASGLAGPALAPGSSVMAPPTAAPG